jgi:hypothetical protein
MSKSPGHLTFFPMVCSPPNQLRTRWPGFSTAAGPRAAAEGLEDHADIRGDIMGAWGYLGMDQYLLIPFLVG